MRNNCVLVCVPTKFLNPKDGKLLEIHRYKPHDHSLLKPYINVFVKWWFSITCCKTKTKDLKITKYQMIRFKTKNKLDMQADSNCSVRNMRPFWTLGLNPD